MLRFSGWRLKANQKDSDGKKYYLIKSIDNTFFFSGSDIEDDSELGGDKHASPKKPWSID